MYVFIFQEKESARKEYQAAVREKKTAVLLEEVKPDVFTIKVTSPLQKHGLYVFECISAVTFIRLDI